MVGPSRCGWVSCEIPTRGKGNVSQIYGGIRVVSGSADSPTNVTSQTLESKGSEQVTLSGSTVGQLTRPADANHMFLSIGGTAGDFLRMKFGSNPSQTVGAKVVVGDYIDLSDPMSDFSDLIDAVRFIRDTAAAANIILDVEYFGPA